MKNKMILLQEGLSALGTNMRAQCATSFRMAFIVKHKTMLGHKALSAVLTKVRFGFLLGWRCDLNDRGLLNLLLVLILLSLLLLLLSHLNRLLLHNVLLHLSLLLWLGLNLNLLVLLRRMRWTLKNLIYNLASRCDYLNGNR